MPEVGPKPTPLQRQAMNLIESGMYASADVPEIVGVKGGYGNEAEFLMRLMDRGWVRLELTDAGRSALQRRYD